MRLSNRYVVCAANESVLRWWFRDKLASLMVDSTLVVDMTANDAKHTQWTIYIAGMHTQRPTCRPSIVSTGLWLSVTMFHTSLQIV